MLIKNVAQDKLKALKNGVHETPLVEELQIWRRRIELSDDIASNFYIACGKDMLEDILPDILEELGFDPRELIRKNGSGYTGVAAGFFMDEFNAKAMHERSSNNTPVLIKGVFDHLDRVGPSHIFNYAHHWDQSFDEYFPRGAVGKIMADAEKRLTAFTWVDTDRPNLNQTCCHILRSQFSSGGIVPVPI